MTASPMMSFRDCRDEGCPTRITLARRAGEQRWSAFEATERPPWTPEAAGSLVLVYSPASREWHAWRPHDLVEHFHVTRGVSEETARELVAGHPWHRLHYHAQEG